jgi:hypothetical protein
MNDQLYCSSEFPTDVKTHSIEFTIEELNRENIKTIGQTHQTCAVFQWFPPPLSSLWTIVRIFQFFRCMPIFTHAQSLKIQLVHACAVTPLRKSEMDQSIQALEKLRIWAQLATVPVASTTDHGASP